MMEETYLVEHIKDTVCFVSPDLKVDLASARAGAHRLEYVLPDGVNEQLGHVRQPQPRERGKTSAADKAGREQVLPGTAPCRAVRCQTSQGFSWIGILDLARQMCQHVWKSFLLPFHALRPMPQ